MNYFDTNNLNINFAKAISNKMDIFYPFIKDLIKGLNYDGLFKNSKIVKIPDEVKSAFGRAVDPSNGTVRHVLSAVDFCNGAINLTDVNLGVFSDCDLTRAFANCSGLKSIRLYGQQYATIGTKQLTEFINSNCSSLESIKFDYYTGSDRVEGLFVNSDWDITNFPTGFFNDFEHFVINVLIHDSTSTQYKIYISQSIYNTKMSDDIKAAAESKNLLITVKEAEA